MTPERYREVGRLYRAALELEPARWAAYLAEACGGDEALRREVAALLDYEARGERLVDQPALEAAAQAMAEDQIRDEAASLAPSLVGESVGHCRILSLLGKGGMGEVWLAEDTQLNRKVAVKLLPAEFTTQPERVRRFAQEARAASALNHPNIITIHEIGAAGKTHYIVTEYVAGETLRQRLTSAPDNRLKLAEAVDLAAQIAAALAAAHEAGITHRDIKPENVMVRRDGIVKVLDFGLAKLTEAAPPVVDSQAATLARHSTEAGVVMGTPRYMSPEQARGEKVDHRSDLFSLGVMLYEMVAGRAPFAGKTTSEIIAAILRDEPPPLADHAPDAPPELAHIIQHTLQKERAARWQTAPELLAALKQLQRQVERQAELTPVDALPAAKRSQANQTPHPSSGARQPMPSGTSRWPRRKLLLSGALALLLSVGGWFVWRAAKLRQVRAALPQIEALTQAERYFEAYDLAVAAQRYLPNDPTLTRLMRTVADELTVVSEPPGAQVYLKPFAPDAAAAARQLIGVTPLNHYQLARGTYVISLEKPGYARLERAVSGLVLRLGGIRAPSPPIRWEARLAEDSRVPARMTFVPGGDYRLVGWARPTAERVRLADFYIDKYEVTNREYKEFINAGGYVKREYWQHKFSKDGRELTWEAALQLFKDQTGLPGPRGWQNQEFPEGKAEHPVTDVSWYEAAAYAAFRGKALPTVFQWEKAARDGVTMDPGIVLPWGLFTGQEALGQRANFDGRGTLPVTTMEFGMSPFGCAHMAGNVAEWCANRLDEGFAMTGGSWADPPYVFGAVGGLPGTYAANKLGFRCVVNTPGAGDQGTMALYPEAAIPVYKPAGAASFRAWQEQYYRYAQPPLDAQISDRKEGDDWRREKISYVGADGERALAFLYLPKHAAPPWQVIQFIPPADIFKGLRPLDQRVEVNLSGFLKAGRAVLAVALKGFQERPWPPHRTEPATPTAEYRDLVLDWIADERRALDYVATRHDLDVTRIAYLSYSSDSGFKFGLPAVEPRYRSVILRGNCLRSGEARVLPEIHPANLIPFIRAPKLFVQGRYDEGCRWKSEAEPLLKLLREPKRLVFYDGGHIAPPEFLVPVVNDWLDETMGPVNRQ